jgi:hypothetical protein
VGLPERLRDLGISVLRIEDVMVEVGADRDRLERHVSKVDERLGRKPCLGNRVVLEMEVRDEIEQPRPSGQVRALIA